MKKLSFAKQGVLLLITLGCLSTAAYAAPRYVNDHLIITLRAGMGDEYKILKSLPTGTKMEVREESGDFSRVRTEDGQEGWVRSWYLTDKPTAGILLQDAQAKAERLASENKRLAEDLTQYREQAESLENQLNKSESELKRVTKENTKLSDLASRPLELERENTQLRETNARVTEQNQKLSSENIELRESSVQKWFMAGGGVLVLGIILGLVLPYVRRRRSSGW